MTSGSGSVALTDAIVTMLPAPRSSRCGTAARVVRTAARKLIVRAVSQSSSVTDRKPPVRGVTPPTLLTRMSSPPNSAIAASISCAGPSGVVRSPWTTRTPTSSGGTVRAPVHDVDALGDQGAGDGQPDALAGSGDDGDLAGQLQVHVTLSLRRRNSSVTLRADPPQTDQESRSPGHRVAPSVTAMTSIENITLEVADTAAAERFYAAAFGLGDRLRLRASEAPSTGFRGFTLSLIVSQLLPTSTP